MPDNLPIRFFEKRRSTDEARKHGGGNDTLPTFALAGQELVARSYALIESLNDEVLNPLWKGNDAALPTVMTVKLNSGVRSKGHRQDVASIFESASHNRVISMPDSESMHVRLDDMQHVATVRERLSDIRTNVVGISGILHIAPYKPSLFLSNEVDVYKVALHSFGESRLDSYLRSQFEGICSESNLQFTEYDYGDGITRYRIIVNAIDFPDRLRHWKGLETIIPMPIYSIELDEFDSEGQISLPEPTDGIAYGVVGLLDSGVARNQALLPWLTPDEFRSYAEQDLNRSHGTAVASVLVFGDSLEARRMAGSNGCRIYSAAIYPADGRLEEGEMIENVRAAIRSRPDIRIWNMSLGSKREADLQRFSEAGKALDSIANEAEILLIKSVGNCKNFQGGSPTSRIAITADSLRSLVVGSIAHKKGRGDLSEVDEVSPFSRRGRGPAYHVKPDLVHYGGNAGPSSITGVTVLREDGSLGSVVGTSFSTPRITAIASHLEQLLDEEFDPTFYKALLIHGSRYPFSCKETGFDRMDSYGYGVPASAPELLHNSLNDVTLVLRDSLGPSEIIDILDFPFPQGLTEDGKYYGQVTVTLVTNPVLLPKNGEEYCQSNVDVAFGTYTRLRRVERSRHYPKGFKVEGRQNLLNAGLYSTSRIRRRGFQPEAVLVNYGQKYHVIKKYSIDLSELRDSTATRQLTAPRRWFLKLTPTFRGLAEADAEEQGAALSIPFCCIVTIRDPSLRGVAYNETVRLLEQNNFIHNAVQLKSRVSLDIKL